MEGTRAKRGASTVLAANGTLELEGRPRVSEDASGGAGPDSTTVFKLLFICKGSLSRVVTLPKEVHFVLNCDLPAPRLRYLPFRGRVFLQ